MCLCGNDKEFNECCAPIINGDKEAQTPEELMRSRYSAYVKGNAKYLLHSTVVENRYQDDIGLIEDFSSKVIWLKLDILRVNKDMVEFKAYYRDNEEIQLLHEKSNFVKEDGVWRYKDGELYTTKIQRNESCPCGSGKKFKRCCG